MKDNFPTSHRRSTNRKTKNPSRIKIVPRRINRIGEIIKFHKMTQTILPIVSYWENTVYYIDIYLSSF